MADLYMRMDRPSEATTAARQALVIFQRMFGPTHPDTQECAQFIAEIDRRLQGNG
jgi:hypothetical protein